MRVLDDELHDAAETDALRADDVERERASRYWAAVPDHERARRREARVAREETGGGPDAYDSVEPADCPVCGLPELTVERVSDAFGLGYGPGVCLACSYRRSEDAANWLAIDLILGRGEDDDPLLNLTGSDG